MTNQKSGRTPNDQRSDVHNSTSAEYKAAMDHNANIHNPTSAEHQAASDNRANQMNPQYHATHGSRKK
jgi:hypothetical protein